MSNGLIAAMKVDSPHLIWPLNEPVGATTAVDVSGNGRNGTYAGSGTLRGTKFGSLGYWQGDASTGRITATVTAPTSTFTMEALVYIPSTSEKGHFFGVVDSVSAATKGYSFGVGISSDNGQVGNLLNGLSENISWVPTGVSAGTGWMHLAIIRNATPNMITYKNGVQVDSRGTGATSFTGTSTFFAGGNTSGGFNRQTGCSLGWVGFWVDSVVSPTRIAVHAAEALRLAVSY